MMRRTLICASLVLACGPAAAHETKLQFLQLIHPWAHGQEKPGATAPRDVAVFMTILNNGGSPDRLLAVSSPLATGGELRWADAGVGQIALAPSAAVRFGTDGPYVVLKGVTDDLAGYEAFPVWLTFEKAGRVEVAVVVEDAAVKNPSCTGSLAPGDLKTDHSTHTR